MKLLIHSQTLTHWGRVTHICVGKLTIIGSDNGFSPGQRQAIIWTNAGIFLIRPLGTNFSEILIKILTFSFKKMRLKVSSAKRRPFCLGLNVLTVAISSHTLQGMCYSSMLGLKLNHVNSKRGPRTPSRSKVLPCLRVNPLRAIFFPREYKHLFVFYVIPPHLFDTGT